MKALMRVGGGLNILTAVFHAMFWKMYDWPESLEGISDMQQGIMQVLNIHCGLAIAFFGYVSLFHTDELLNSKIGKLLLLFISVFYLIRTINESIFWDFHFPDSLFVSLIGLTFSMIYFLGWRWANHRQIS